MDAFNVGSVLSWQRTQDAAAHQAELRRGRHAWIALPSALLQTRYQLNATDLSFGGTEAATTIQALFRNSQLSGGIAFNQYYLIAEPHADEPCYNISDYVQRCVAGDLTIAERLRGRTVINLHQTEGAADDLLSDEGVSQFIERMLTNYLKTYGKQHLVGFTCEPPKFLALASVLGAGTASVPWSPALLEAADTTLATYLPLVFYETYNSAAVRNTFWKALTTRFATCFLRGLRDFCHQEGLRLALSLSASAKMLEFELGAMLAEVDVPILNTTEIDTPKRFVVAKWACSDTQYAGIARKTGNKTDACTATSRLLEDASFGFNLWMNRNSAADSVPQGLATGYPKRPILIVAPTQSLWTKPDEKSWSSITKAWGWLCQSVWELGYDFKIVSEQELSAAEVIAAAAARQRGLKRGGLCFPNNGTDTPEIYNVVLLPSCISLQEETVKRLKGFTKAKGRLIVDERTPYLLNGRIGLEPYPLEQLIFGRRATILRGPPDEKVVKLEKCLRKWVTRPVSVYVKPENDPTDNIHVLHRAAEASEIFYLFNTSSESMKTLIEIQRQAASVAELDLFNGRRENVPFWHADGKTYLNCTFAPRQARLFGVS